MSQSPPPNLISVLSSTAKGVVGFLLISARGFQALDADGRPLALFGEKQSAVERIVSAVST
jgi:hypothetical protein